MLILVGVGCYLIPSPFSTHAPRIPTRTSHSEVAVRGTWDTTRISHAPIYGVDDWVDNEITYVAQTEPVIVLALPDYVENLAQVRDKAVVGIIRATAYPYIENDTLQVELVLEWNLQPRPTESYSRTDTVFSVDSLWFEAEKPFIEEPIVVMTGTFVGVAILYGIVEFIKSLGK